MPVLCRVLCAGLVALGGAGASGAESASEIRTGAIESEYGCSVAYERHEPAGEPKNEVILAHGFMRKLEHMRGWGKLWSGEGIAVTLVSFCNSSWLNGHHRRNADDLIAVRHHLGLKTVVYAGFSAGGLAAYMAAAEDPGTAAYLGLDSVDSGDLAVDMSKPLSRPALFIVGEPSMCNARGNFQPVFERWPQYEVKAVEGASHCHFELPYEKRCAWLCGGASDHETVVIQSEIQRLTTQWLTRQ